MLVVYVGCIFVLYIYMSPYPYLNPYLYLYLHGSRVVTRTFSDGRTDGRPDDRTMAAGASMT
jgi:hypothetical protein